MLSVEAMLDQLEQITKARVGMEQSREANVLLWAKHTKLKVLWSAQKLLPRKSRPAAWRIFQSQLNKAAHTSRGLNLPSEVSAALEHYCTCNLPPDM